MNQTIGLYVSDSFWTKFIKCFKEAININHPKYKVNMISLLESDPDASLTLFVTKPNGKKYVFQRSDLINQNKVFAKYFSEYTYALSQAEADHCLRMTEKDRAVG